MTWASARTGITLDVQPVDRDLEPALAGSVSLGLRHNPKRLQLLVSSVLGKHVPVRASLCLRAGAALGQAIDVQGPVDVFGFAETATGLGHQVAHELRAGMYVHTTRRPAEGQLQFLEEHSHAVEQALSLPQQGFSSTTAVLVDDEVSTGRTALNAIRALAPATGHTTWVLASLLDSRSPADHDACRQQAAALGVELRHASLLTGTVTTSGHQESFPALPVTAAGPVERTTLTLGTRGLRTTARQGFTPLDDAALRWLARRAAQALPAMVDPIVLGDEELMYLPQLLAQELGDSRTCTTTRSPAVVVDSPGYPLRSGVAFDAISEPGRVAYSYNTTRSPETLLLVTEDPVDDRGVVAALSSAGGRVVVLTLDPTATAGSVR